MKKISFLFLFVLLFTFVLVGCKEDEPVETPTYTVEFNSTLGTSVESQTVKENEMAVKPADPTREGYAFDGWYLDDEEYNFDTPVTANITLVAQWEQLYKVEFYAGLQGSNLIDTQYVKSGESATAPDESLTVIEGYVFTGWNGNFSNVQSDLKITADYKLAEYTITYYAFGEVFRVDGACHGDTIQPQPLMDVEGYIFQGWDKTEELLYVTSNLDVHAIYVPIEYTIQYYLIDTEYTDLAETYNIETEVTLPTDIQREGCTFAGWYTDPTFAGEIVTTIPAGTTGNKVYYAKFSGTTTILVDPAVASLEVGATYELNEKSYVVGTNVVATIAEALTKLQNDGTSLEVQVVAGTYTEDVTIASSNVLLVGPNAVADGALAVERVEEAVITGIITLGAEVDNITIDGFKFEGNAQVIGEAALKKGDSANPSYNHENFVFKNNVVNVKLDQEAVDGFIVLKEVANSYSYNTQLVNNVFELANNTKASNMVWMDNNEDLKVLNNVFRNVLGTAIYVTDTSKGCSGKDVQFVGNTFDNIGGSGIWLNWVSPRINSKNGKYVIDENIFNNVGTSAEDCAIYFGSINNGDTIELISFSKNEFTACTVCVNVVRSHTNGQPLLDGNIFYDTPEYYYIVCNNTASGDATPANVALTNSVFHHAFVAAQFAGTVELVEGNASLCDAVVSSEWAGKAAGETVEVNGKEYVIGTSAYATLAEAAGKAYEQATYITVLPGTYAEDFTIVSSGLTLNGPSAAISGTGTRAEAEAVITGTITVAGGVNELRIDGFKFAENAQIIAKANSGYSHENVEFVNNLVSVNLNEAEVLGFMVFEELDASYTRNLVVKNNLFELAEDTKALAVISLNNVENLYVLNNKFISVKGNAIYVDDAGKGLSGEDCSISGNTFENVLGTAILVDWMSPKAGVTNGQYKFDNNTFNVVGTAMYLGKPNNVDVIKLFSVSGNTFIGSLENGLVMPRAISGATYVVEGNVFEVVPTGVYFNIVSSTTAVTEVVVIENEYKDNGNIIVELDATKFIGDIRYKKGEAVVVYNLGGYESHSELVTAFLTDFYNWLVAKGNLDTTAITLEAFLDNKETDAYPFDGSWYNYMGCVDVSSLDNAYPYASEFDFLYLKGGNSETVDENYFVNSAENIEKWGPLLDAVNEKFNKWNSRVWADKYGGAYDLTKWINAYVSSAYNDANLVLEKYNEEFIIETVYSAENCTILEIPAKEGYVGSWNTSADGSGITITALDPNNIVDLVLYAVYTPVEDGE